MQYPSGGAVSVTFDHVQFSYDAAKAPAEAITEAKSEATSETRAPAVSVLEGRKLQGLPG